MSTRPGHPDPTFVEMEEQRQGDWWRQYTRFRGPEKDIHPDDGAGLARKFNARAERFVIPRDILPEEE